MDGTTLSVMMDTTTDLLTIDDMARLAGVKRRSIDQYRTRGTIPEPDGYVGRTPWWSRDTAVRWIAERPGRGRPQRATVMPRSSATVNETKRNEETDGPT
jgi:predicted DNA-binding transcriptional regulator AlpA